MRLVRSPTRRTPRRRLPSAPSIPVPPCGHPFPPSLHLCHFLRFFIREFLACSFVLVLSSRSIAPSMATCITSPAEDDDIAADSVVATASDDRSDKLARDRLIEKNLPL